MVRVVLICRDHLDNPLFEAEVQRLEDEKEVWNECRKYGDDVWLDYALYDDNTEEGG